MRGTRDKQDFGLVITLLRAIRGWNRPALAQESGVDKDLIADYERGVRSPFRSNRERLAAAFGVEPAFLAELVPACRSLRLAYESAVRGGRAAAPPAADIAQRLEGKVGGAVLEAMEPFLLELAELDPRPAPRAGDRSWAEELWATLEPLPADSQARICKVLQGDERSWALAARIGEASRAAAPHSAEEALRLSRLAASFA